MLYRYSAYGLGIQSTLALPEFVKADIGCDVVIREGSKEDVPAEVPPNGWYLKITPEEVILSYRDIGVFILCGGREVTIVRCQGVAEALLRLYLSGTVMALLQYQRGRLVLHASAVVVGDSAVAFLGRSGQGKTTLAANLYHRGHAIIADDISPTQTVDGVTSVVPGFPQFKLTREVAQAMGQASESLLFLPSKKDKRGWRVTERFVRAPVPFRSMYILRTGSHCAIYPLPPQEALIELIRNSYPTRLCKSGGTKHLHQCAELVKRVPAFVLQRSERLDDLPYLAQLVEDHSRVLGSQVDSALITPESGTAGRMPLSV